MVNVPSETCDVVGGASEVVQGFTKLGGLGWGNIIISVYFNSDSTASLASNCHGASRLGITLARWEGVH